jgi:hypothetical protein
MSDMFDDLVPGATPAPESSGEPASPASGMFDDLKPKQDRSYIGASAIAGAKEAGATVLSGLAAIPQSLFGLSEDEAAILYKDPAELQKWKDSAAGKIGGAGSRAVSALNESAAQTMKELSPEGQRVASLRYATTDTGQAAYLSGQRIIGDIARSAPSMAVMAVGAKGARGSYNTAYADAVANGATEAVARAAGARAAAATMGQVEAVGEAGIGYSQQSEGAQR